MTKHLCLSVVLAAVAGAVALPAPAQEAAGDADRQQGWRDCMDAYNDARQKRRWEEYRELAKAFAAKFPDHFEVRWALAKSFEEESNKGQAHEWYLKASDLDKDHFEAALESGMGHMRYQAKDKAIPFLERALAALPGGKGMPTDEKQVELAKYALPGALVEAFWEQGEAHKDQTKGQALKDKAVEIAEKAVTAAPVFPGVLYYLGVSAEEHGDQDRAIAYYVKGAGSKVEGVYAQANHKYGIEDRRSESNSRQVYLKNTQVKYGEIKNDGMRFVDATKEFTMDKPHPRALKLKKDAKHPWDYWFQVSHESKDANSVVTHIIDLVRRSSNGFEHDVLVRCFGGAHTLSMNTKTAGAVKWDSAEKVAEGLESDMIKDAWIEVTGHQPVKPAKFGGRLKSYYFTFTGKNKADVELNAKNKADGKRVLEVKPWEIHIWTMKAKKNTFYVQVQGREGMWLKYQKEIQLILRGIKFP